MESLVAYKLQQHWQVSSCTGYKNLFWQNLNYLKVYTSSKTTGQIKITSEIPKQVPNLIIMPKTKYNYIYQMQQGICKFSLSIFLFIYIFQTKDWSYHWLKFIAGDWVQQIWSYRLNHKSHVAEFPFQKKLMHVWKNTFFV